MAFSRWTIVQWVVLIALIGLFLSALVIHFSITDGKMSVSDWIILKINHTYFRYKLSRHRYINERDFPKLTFPLPLANDSVQLFAFASAVNRYDHAAGLSYSPSSSTVIPNNILYQSPVFVHGDGSVERLEVPTHRTDAGQALL